MTRVTRRGFLATGAVTTVALSGCLGMGNSGEGSAEALVVETLDVGGSDGGEVVVKPPDTAVLIDFFATFCPPCKPQMAELGEIDERYPDLHMLSISWERDTDEIEAFWREYDGTWPVAHEPEMRVADRYDIGGRLPTKLVFDTAGEEIWRDSGLSRAETIAEHVERALE